MANKYEFEMGFFESLHQRMPKDTKVAAILAHLYTESGRIDSGLKMDRKLARLLPEDPTVHYNLACSLALKGRLADAVRSLRTAVSFGYKDVYWMRNDPDLSQLHEYPAFNTLLRDLEVG
jgi:predicted Zn-dependent protease